MSTQTAIALSRLVSNKRNPRRVKPGKIAHHTLVALIRAHGLLQPLVVRPVGDGSKEFIVIAGSRRLKALKEIHRNDGDPKIPCVVKDVDEGTAEAMSLGENFGREPMHPLDEAEAFARLASQDGKGADMIASEFGVTERYVRQRMKLATLAKPIKESYRSDAIDTATAEAFAAVPEERQLAIWQEVNTAPRNAEHVRRIVASQWIDLKRAVFDRSVLPESAVSQDLFSEQVLVERSAFLEAQATALAAERERLLEDGWSEVIVGNRTDVQDRLYAMDALEPEFDAATNKKLDTLASQQKKLEKLARRLGQNHPKLERLQKRYDALDERMQKIEESATLSFSDATKSRSTVFLLLDPDGSVYREYRRPRKSRSSKNGGNGGSVGGDRSDCATPEPPLTSDDISDRQKAVINAHLVVSVRKAAFENEAVLKRLLVMALHDKIQSSILSVRHEANTTTLHATNNPDFKSTAHQAIIEKRKKLDAFPGDKPVHAVQAYTVLSQMKSWDVDELIKTLVVCLLMDNPQCSSPLMHDLAKELKISIRDDWTPDAAWLSGYQKIQLSHLVTKLLGEAHASGPDVKKSQLVETLTKLFVDAETGDVGDKTIMKRLLDWSPLNWSS